MKNQKYTISIFTFLVFAALVGFSISSLKSDRDVVNESTAPTNTMEQFTSTIGTLPSADDEAILYNQSELVSNPGAGAGGADASAITDPGTLFGYGNAISTFFRMADDFTVPPGETWLIDSIILFHYQTGSPTTSTINAVNLRIWDGATPGTGNVVAGDTSTNRLGATYFSNIYRVTSTTLTNNQRPIMRSQANMTGTVLPSGTYWIDYAAGGTLASGPWNPPRTIVGQPVTGNAYQRSNAGVWAPALDGTNPQGVPFIIYGSVQGPPVGGSTLILLHDSTVVGSQAKRRADQDSLMKYIPQLVGNYTLQTFTATTDLTGLDSYDAIFLVETSFDDLTVRYLSANSRTAIKNWLNAGTPVNKRAFLTMGADQGYNYARTGSAALDLELSEGLLKFGYRADNSNLAATPGITGTTIDVGNDRIMTTAPAGGGFWPDGGILQAGGTDLYKYRGRVSLTDSLAGIGYNGSGYVSVTILQDPRYFTGELKEVLAAGIKYLTDNGGLITSIGNNNVSEITADQFILSQNYPNPFNPTTKINFAIPQTGLVSLKVYDIMGREVATLVNEVKNTGVYTVEFNGATLSSGTYFVRMQAGEFSQVKRMVLVK